MNDLAVRINNEYEFNIINHFMLNSKIEYTYNQLINETEKLWLIKNSKVDNYVSLLDYLIQNDYKEVTVKEYLDLNEILYYYTSEGFLFTNWIHPKLYWINRNTNEIGYDEENTIRLFDIENYIYFQDIDEYLIYINTILNKNNLNNKTMSKYFYAQPPTQEVQVGDIIFYSYTDEEDDSKVTDSFIEIVERNNELHTKIRIITLDNGNTFEEFNDETPMLLSYSVDESKLTNILLPYFQYIGKVGVNDNLLTLEYANSLNPVNEEYEEYEDEITEELIEEFEMEKELNVFI